MTLTAPPEQRGPGRSRGTTAPGAGPRSADAAVDDVARTADLLRDQARAALGVTGESSSAVPLRLALRKHGTSTYPLLALGVLGIVDLFQAYAFTVLTPDISRALGIGIAAIGGISALAALMSTLAPLPMAALTQNRARRAVLCLVTGIAWSLITLSTGFVTSVLGLLLLLCLDNFSTGTVLALHPPLLFDHYHPESRVRVLSGYSAMVKAGQVASPLLVALLAGPLGLTWRGVFIGLGAISTLSTLVALGLRDPGFGRWDTQRLREQVHDLHGEAGDALSADEVKLGFFEICRRLLLIPTLKRLYVGFAVFGVMLTPLSVFLSFFLERQWGLDAGQRGLFTAYYSACSVIGLAIYGNRGERAFRRSPAGVLQLTGSALGTAIVLIGIGGLVPNFVVMCVCFGLAFAAVGVVFPGLTIASLSIVPATTRAHAQALGGLFISIGGIGGALLLGSVYEQYGPLGSVIAIGVFGVLGAVLIARSGASIEADLDRMISGVLEEEEIRRITTSGGRLPMLACRGVDFSYGQLQVLFDVNFTVDDGEMVALLGVNGAGKSTLLKVISGIGLPSRGSVRFRGQDITFLDAERRVGLGITQIPGGKAVFGPMTVVENLRSYAYSANLDRRRIESRIDECFEAFPRLAERRGSLAAQLSGGEQQMLALSKALILEPRLLVIDELSLGLAPVIVGQLLDMVRRIHAGGTAVVLVEQSVNIALNLVDHAYFMEKGEMKFDGPAQELLARDDLLRAVFLAGAAAGGAA